MHALVAHHPLDNSVFCLVLQGSHRPKPAQLHAAGALLRVLQLRFAGRPSYCHSALHVCALACCRPGLSTAQGEPMGIMHQQVNMTLRTSAH